MITRVQELPSFQPIVNNYPPLKPIITSELFEMIGIDVLEMGLTSAGNLHNLSVVDHFTKWGGVCSILKIERGSSAY